MRSFAYDRARSLTDAASLASREGAWLIAGGTNMTDYMKLGVVEPQRLIDINALEGGTLRAIEAAGDGLRLGGLVRMAEVEDHETVRRDYPVIAESLKLAASRQIRNMASLGGNLLQRTRCEYFRHTMWPCNKRAPRSGCAAMDGINRRHALLGTSEHCIATYPGDFAQALVALEAMVSLKGESGARDIPIGDLHRLPGNTPHIETVLKPGEVITAITVPRQPWFRRSRYVKVRDRESYDFALASAAVALDMDGQVVRDVRIALGGLATKPWRALAAEDVLRGRPLMEDTAREAAEAAFTEAVPREHTAFKIPLGQATLCRALIETRDMEVGQHG